MQDLVRTEQQPVAMFDSAAEDWRDFDVPRTQDDVNRIMVRGSAGGPHQASSMMHRAGRGVDLGAQAVVYRSMGLHG